MTPKHLRIGIGVFVCIVAVIVYFSSTSVTAKNVQQPLAGSVAQNSLPANSTLVTAPEGEVTPNAGYSTNAPGTTSGTASGTTSELNSRVNSQPVLRDTSKPAMNVPAQNTPSPQGTP